jgi:hypothetical protein
VKTYFTALFLILLALTARAQDQWEDVIRITNGSIYRGTIIEQIPGASYKIQIAGGSVIFVMAGDIEKVTKVNKIVIDTAINQSHPYTQQEWQDLHSRGGYRPHRSKSRPARGYKDQGYFFETQFHIDAVGGGVRMINGYKINQYAILGIGIGLGGVGVPANEISATSYSSLYFLFFLYYSGDILKKDITPFYVLEAGYAMAGNPTFAGDYPEGVPRMTVRGGPMGSAGFGVRMYLGRKFTLSISADLDIQYARSETYTWYGYAPSTDVFSSLTMLLPGIKIGLGMVK